MKNIDPIPSYDFFKSWFALELRWWTWLKFTILREQPNQKFWNWLPWVNIYRCGFWGFEKLYFLWPTKSRTRKKISNPLTKVIAFWNLENTGNYSTHTDFNRVFPRMSIFEISNLSSPTFFYPTILKVYLVVHRDN